MFWRLSVKARRPALAILHRGQSIRQLVQRLLMLNVSRDQKVKTKIQHCTSLSPQQYTRQVWSWQDEQFSGYARHIQTSQWFVVFASIQWKGAFRFLTPKTKSALSFLTEFSCRVQMGIFFSNLLWKLDDWSFSQLDADHVVYGAAQRHFSISAVFHSVRAQETFVVVTVWAGKMDLYSNNIDFALSMIHKHRQTAAGALSRSHPSHSPCRQL